MMTCNQFKEQLGTIKAYTSWLNNSLSTIDQLRDFDESKDLVSTIREKLKPFKKEIMLRRLEQAERILGPNHFLGPKAVEKVFGVTFKPEELPPLNLTRRELEAIKQKDKILVLRIDRAHNGMPLTVNRMTSELKIKHQIQNDNIVLFKNGVSFADLHLDMNNQDLVRQKHEILGEQTPKLEWVVIDKKPIPINYGYSWGIHSVANLAQESQLKSYRDASRKFSQKLSRFNSESESDYLKRIKNYEIIQLCLPSVVEVIYDLAIDMMSREDPHTNIIAKQSFQDEYSVLGKEDKLASITSNILIIDMGKGTKRSFYLSVKYEARHGDEGIDLLKMIVTINSASGGTTYDAFYFQERINR